MLTNIATIFWGLAVLVGLRIILTLVAMLDAYIVATNMTERSPRSYNKWFIYVLVILLTFLAGSFTSSYLRRNKLRAWRIPTGYHSILWDGQDYSGLVAASGVYLYRIKAGGANGRNFTRTLRMTLIK